MALEVALIPVATTLTRPGEAAFTLGELNSGAETEPVL